MEETYDHLIEVLEQSIKKNGEKPLTNLYLLNILKLTRKRMEWDDSHDFYPDING